MKQFLKEYGGWLTWVITLIFASALFVFTQKQQAKDIEEIKTALKEISALMLEQATLNGQMIQYMEEGK